MPKPKKLNQDDRINEFILEIAPTRGATKATEQIAKLSEITLNVFKSPALHKATMDLIAAAMQRLYHAGVVDALDTMKGDKLT